MNAPFSGYTQDASQELDYPLSRTDNVMNDTMYTKNIYMMTYEKNVMTYIDTTMLTS